MINTFDPKLVGNTIAMTTKFYDSNSAEITPDTVTLKFKKPDGSVTSQSVTQTLGKYSASVLLDASGVWYFRWECSGSHASAEEFSINVRASYLD